MKIIEPGNRTKNRFHNFYLHWEKPTGLKKNKSSFSNNLKLNNKRVWLLVVIFIMTIACNFPTSSFIQNTPVETTSSTIGPEGGVIVGSGGVELVVPEDAFSTSVDISLSVGKQHPALPRDSGIKPAGASVEVTLPPGVEPNSILELIIPFERDKSAGDDHYTVLRWDGKQWTEAGGLVEGDFIRIRTNQFSTFMPAQVVWALRPVSFVNDGPFDAVVMPWTYQPLNPFSGVLPPRLATASFAPGGPGLWPNTSRFMGLPLGTYTFCIEWDKEEDLDGDGKTDVYHAFLEGPSTDLPLLLDERDPIKMTFATEVRFRTDPVGAMEGKCADSTASEWIVRLLHIDVRNSDHPPRTIAVAQYDTNPPPPNVSITSVANLWKGSNGELIALYSGGDWISATCSDQDVTVVGVRFESDSNDGWVRVLVDAREVWRGSIYGGDPSSEEGMYLNYLEISGLEPGIHTIMVENLGINGEGGGDDAAIRYFGFGTSPYPAP